MKKNYLKLGLIIACLAPSAAALAQGGLIQSEWRTINSGEWDDPTPTGGVWKYYKNSTQGWINRTQANGPDKGIPRSTVSATHNLTFKTPHKSPQTIGRLFVETDASLTGSSDTLRQIKFYGDTVGIYGTLGALSGPSMIDFQVWSGTETGYPKSQIVIGSGNITLQSLRFGASTLASWAFVDTFSVRNTIKINGGLFSIYYNSANNSVNDALIMNIDPGATVKLTDTSAFHMRVDSTGKVGGNMTYNINGTLDLSASTGSSNFIAPSNAASNLALNVSGLLKMGKNFNTLPSPGYGAGSINMTINSGGVVDAGMVTTSNARFGAKQWMANGTGILKRYVSAADTIFPVTKLATSNNSVMLNTAAADTFSVSAVTPAYSFLGGQTVSTEWRINKKSTGDAKLTASFMWTTLDQASTMSTVSVYVYTGKQWKEYAVSSANFSGAGTLASPYKATATGIDSIQIAYVGTVGLNLNPNPAGIKNINANNNLVSVAPNPVANGNFALQMKDVATGSYSIAIYNITGQKVYNQEIKHTVGNNAYTVWLPSGISSGIYQLSVAGDNFTAVKKLVIQ